ncbi:MAG: hypothetical protein ACUVUE_00695 [Candidatus Bathycorpusculaceae bacterium]
MMRTIEVLLIIIIITGAFAIASFFAVLPSPRQISPVSLRRLAWTTLETLDQDYDLSKVAFETNNDTLWSRFQIALSASLPPNVVYNLTVYEISESESATSLYTAKKSISNAESLGISSDASSYLVSSSNVTFDVIPEKIGERGGGGTLYILNCSDANGWWITGYTANSLAEDLYKQLSRHFVTTIMVQNTDEFAQILNGTSLQGEALQNAVVINTVGEAVPIPAEYYASPDVGYDPIDGSYARYCYTLGQKVREYNWTWVSIVGYPLYYVCNTALFLNEQNTWGIYGMRLVGASGLNAFLKGLDNQTYSYDSSWITGSPGIVYLSDEAMYYCNYYGIYPSVYHTSTRALPSSITSTYNLNVTTYVLNPQDDWNPGAIYRHFSIGDNNATGALFALGLARTPDIRLTVLGILSDYKPRLYHSLYTASEASRLVVLQLGLVGGV